MDTITVPFSGLYELGRQASTSGLVVSRPLRVCMEMASAALVSNHTTTRRVLKFDFDPKDVVSGQTESICQGYEY